MIPITTVISERAANDHMEAHRLRLSTDRGAIPIRLTTEWAKRFPEKPGVYCVFAKGELIYVGETGNLRGRMRDLRDTRNHSLRRQLGDEVFGGCRGFRSANSSRKFPRVIEDRLNRHMERHLLVRGLSVLLGRKEIEEQLIDRERPRYNRRKRRGETP